MSQADSPPTNANGPDPRTTYWRSLDELRFTPQFEEYLHREFPKAASEFPEGVSRRRWLQLMGASLSLAGVAGCRWEAEQFLPHAGRVPDYIPGEPQFFATMHELRGFARALLVRQFDGRPVKVEGNPEHPQSTVALDIAKLLAEGSEDEKRRSHGATDVFAQACILDLYDPDRIGRPRELEGQKATGRSWEEAERSIRTLMEQAGDGGKLRVLASASSSPSRLRLEEALARRFPQMRWVEYEPLSWFGVTQGAQQAFGRRLRPQYRFGAADIILVIDGDPLGADPDQIRHSREWASRRTPEATGPDGQPISMNRLYVVESQYSSTGVAADHREPVASSRIPQFLADLEKAIGQTGGGGKAQSGNPFIDALASDLAGHRGKGLIYVGPRQPAAVHARVHRLNAQLGNLGQTVLLVEEPQPERPDPVQAIAQLADEMRNGQVDTLVVLRGNPVYDAPADVRFAEALAKVPNAIHLSEYHNETSGLCRWYLPGTHAFEQWGDGRSYDGTLTLQQPLIEPLHGGRSDIELLAMLLGDGPRRGEQIVRETFGGEETAWRAALHDGFVRDSAYQPVDAAPMGDGGQGERGDAPGQDEFEIVFCESPQVYDGRFANNGWLQEAPDFLTKLTWDNAAVFSWTDAERLGIKNQDVVRLTLGDASVELPVYVLPGQAVGSIGVALGYGRTSAGLVGGYDSGDEKRRAETVGKNVYPLRTTKAMSFARGVKVEPTGATVPMAITQDHFAIDPLGQQEIANRVPVLVREGTEAAYREFEKEPEAKGEGAFAQHLAHVHHPPLESMWKSPDYAQGHAWGMAVDLSKCIGCNACVVACQSENNVPVVGKEQVLRGREMHWLRIDRYFRGNPKVEGAANEKEGVNAGDRGGVVVVGQPVLCMHCEHAPCEQVCPVAAAVHDREGLNLMVYNRCVGTRYCNNNCPYKVRRFNFLNYAKQPANKKYRGLNVIQPGAPETDGATVESLARMVENPEVTVRSRGVMEKCTYCIQRIQNAKIEARNESVRNGEPGTFVPDGAIQTACGQACPTNAIVFGDTLDENSLVYKLHRNPRTYALLEELNVRPRTRYLARIRNPHPDLAELEAYYTPATGHAGQHHDAAGGGHGEHEEEAHHT